MALMMDGGSSSTYATPSHSVSQTKVETQKLQVKEVKSCSKPASPAQPALPVARSAPVSKPSAKAAASSPKPALSAVVKGVTIDGSWST